MPSSDIDPEASAESLKEEVADLARQLAPLGWRIQLRIEGQRFNFVIDHDLTIPSTVMGTVDLPGALTWLGQQWAKNEFAIIKRAPPDQRNWTLMGKLRNSGAGNHWTQQTLYIIAWILHSESILNDAEADWLGTAGIPWECNAERSLAQEE